MPPPTFTATKSKGNRGACRTGRWIIIAVAALMTLTAPAWAKPKGCFTRAEISSDQIIRHGVYLREAALRCNDYEPGSWAEWKQIDNKFGTKFRAERTRREGGFKREFPDSWLKDVTTFDAKLVTFDRNLPYNDAFCADIKDLLDNIQKKGWGEFTAQSKKIRDQARMEFVPCD